MLLSEFVCILDRMKFKGLIILLSILCFQELIAQDARYSQFYASPLTLNPAFTGLNSARYRVSTLFRSQGTSLSSPFTTYSSNYDMNFGKRAFAREYFGVGFSVLNDFLGGGAIVNNQFTASGAFHKILSRRHLLSGGLQLGVSSMSIRNYQDLTMPDNHNGYAYTQGFNNDPNLRVNGKPMFDANIGILHLGKIGRNNIFSGISIYHLVPMKSGLHNVSTNNYRRFTVHGGYKYKILEVYKLTPHFIFNSQGPSSELNIGLNFENCIPDSKNPDAVFSFGTYFRINGGPNDGLTGGAANALIFIAGMSIQDFNMGISYDANMSDISAISNSLYAWELTLSYDGMFNGKSSKRLNHGCPKW